MSITAPDFGTGSAQHYRHTVDIAGVTWPLYKLQAVAAWFIAAMIVIVGTGSAAIAVWVASIAAVAVWWIQRIRHHRYSHC